MYILSKYIFIDTGSLHTRVMADIQEKIKQECEIKEEKYRSSKTRSRSRNQFLYYEIAGPSKRREAKLWL